MSSDGAHARPRKPIKTKQIRLADGDVLTKLPPDATFKVVGNAILEASYDDGSEPWWEELLVREFTLTRAVVRG